MKKIISAIIVIIECSGFINSQELVQIKGGSFMMGCTDSTCSENQLPVHTVELSDFKIGKYEVTNAEYCAFLNENAGSKSIGSWINIYGTGNENCHIFIEDSVYKVEKGFDNHPVSYVSWYGADAYCKHYGFRLPTEAEWEYVAKGGKNYKYSWGNGIPDKKKGGNIGDETLKKHFKKPDWKVWDGYKDGFATSAPVGSFLPNSFGVYDMTGNVSEWCSDRYSKDYSESVNNKNPQGPKTGRTYVVRGGAWGNDPESITTTYRAPVPPQVQFWLMGFRVAE